MVMALLVVGGHSLGDAPVGGENEDGRHVTLEGAVEEREALNVEHVHLVYEQNLCAANTPSVTSHPAQTTQAKQGSSLISLMKILPFRNCLLKTKIIANKQHYFQ